MRLIPQSRSNIPTRPQAPTTRGISVSDPSGLSGRAISVVTATGTVPLEASAGDNETVTVGVPTILDASGSQPSSSIKSYSWTFGDGTTGAGASVRHTYTSPGDYTATVTVSTGTSQATAESQITVLEAATQSQGLEIAVTDGNSQIEGASLAVIAPDGTRYSATTADNGEGVIDGLPDGSYTVYGYAPGYLPGTTHATVTGGVGAASLTLESGSIAQTSATSTVLDEQQIEAAGLDPNDPANQNVVQFQNPPRI